MTTYSEGKDVINSGSTSDIIYAEGGNDIVNAGGGADTVYGGTGDDKISGDAGNDILYGDEGNDNLDGGTGNDILDGGEGNDTVNGGTGDDRLIYNMSENVGDIDRYLGGSGADVIELQFTLAEWARADVQADIERYMAFLAARTGTGEIGTPFQFTAFNLTVQQFEMLDVVVDGKLINLTGNDAAIVGATDLAGSVTEVADGALGENSAVHSESGFINFTDVDLDEIHTLTVTPGGSSYLGTFSATVADDSTVDGTGQVTWSFEVDDSALESLDGDQSVTQTYQIAVSDGPGSFVRTVTITIQGSNDAATITVANPSAVSEDAGAVVSFNVADYVTITDPDAQDAAAADGYVNGTGSFVASGPTPPDGTLSDLFNFNATSGAVSYDPADFNWLDGDQSVTYTISFNAQSGDDGQVAKQLVVTINGVNDAATITVVDPAAVTEDAGAAVSFNVADYVTITDPDLQDVADDYVNGSGSFVASGPTPPDGTLDDLFTFDAPSGSVSYDPADFGWLDSGEQVTYTISFDTQSGDDGLVAKQLVVTINGANDAPVIDVEASDLDPTGAEDGVVTGQIVATDIDGEALTYTAPAKGGTGGPAHGTVSFDAAGNYTYTPDADWFGTDSFTVTVSDGDLTDTVEVEVTVTPVNDAPVAQNDSNTATEGGAAVLGSVAGNDSDVDDAAETLTYSLNAPVAGLTLGADGAYSFDPTNTAYDHLAAGDSAQVVATYTVSDGELSDTATLTITVAGTNDDPDAVTDVLAATEDTPLVFAASDLLGNDTDVDDGTALSVLSVGNPANGTVSLVDGQITFTPAANFHGAASFDYTVSDGDGGTDTVTVTVNVASVNDLPVINEGASNLTGSANEDNAVTGAIVASDVDGDTLSYSVPAKGDTNGPTNGSVTIGSNGGYTYTPDANWSGSDSFTVTVSDGNGGEDTVVVNVSINPVNDAPVLNDPIDISYTDTSAADNFAGSGGTLVATDIDSAPLTYNLSGSAADNSLAGFNVSVTSAYGKMYLNTTSGVYHFEPNDAAINALATGSNPSVSFQFTASDGSLTSATQTLTVQLTGANESVSLPTLPAVDTTNDDPFDFDTAPANAVLFSTLKADELNNTNNILKGTTGDDNGTQTSIDGKSGNDTIYALAGNDVINGGTGLDTVYGGEGSDTIIGDNNGDTLYGGSGSDTIEGKEGSDTLIGGYGADRLTGGTDSADTFVYLSTRDTGDTITDFQIGSDDIDLSAIDANTTNGAGTNDAFTFIDGDSTALQAYSVVYHYDGVYTHIWADTDGNAATAEFAIKLEGNIDLSSGDFIL